MQHYVYAPATELLRSPSLSVNLMRRPPKNLMLKTLIQDSCFKRKRAETNKPESLWFEKTQCQSLLRDYSHS